MVKYDTLIYIMKHYTDGTTLSKATRGAINTFEYGIHNDAKENARRQAGVFNKDGEQIGHDYAKVFTGEMTLKDKGEWKKNNEKELSYMGHHPTNPKEEYEGSIRTPYEHSSDLPPLLSKDECFLLSETNNNGDYLFRSVGCESPSGYRISLIRGNDFDFKGDNIITGGPDGLAFNKLVGQIGVQTRQYYKKYEEQYASIEDGVAYRYKKDHNINTIYTNTPEWREIRTKARRKTIQRIGSLHQHFKESGLDKKAKEAHCRLKVQKMDEYNDNAV